MGTLLSVCWLPPFYPERGSGIWRVQSPLYLAPRRCTNRRVAHSENSTWSTVSGSEQQRCYVLWHHPKPLLLTFSVKVNVELIWLQAALPLLGFVCGFYWVATRGSNQWQLISLLGGGSFNVDSWNLWSWKKSNLPNPQALKSLPLLVFKIQTLSKLNVLLSDICNVFPRGNSCFWN